MRVISAYNYLCGVRFADQALSWTGAVERDGSAVGGRVSAVGGGAHCRAGLAVGAVPQPWRWKSNPWLVWSEAGVLIPAGAVTASCRPIPPPRRRAAQIPWPRKVRASGSAGVRISNGTVVHNPESISCAPVWRDGRAGNWRSLLTCCPGDSLPIAQGM